jgi:ribonucleoside-diphosphate reductase alpha chain
MKWQPPSRCKPFTPATGGARARLAAIVTAGIEAHGIRNAAQTTVAPTGTIATVVGCEGYGCEPVFALGYTRHFKDGDKRRRVALHQPAL